MDTTGTRWHYVLDKFKEIQHWHHTIAHAEQILLDPTSTHNWVWIEFGMAGEGATKPCRAPRPPNQSSKGDKHREGPVHIRCRQSTAAPSWTPPSLPGSPTTTVACTGGGRSPHQVSPTIFRRQCGPVSCMVGDCYVSTEAGQLRALPGKAVFQGGGGSLTNVIYMNITTLFLSKKTSTWRNKIRRPWRDLYIWIGAPVIWHVNSTKIIFCIFTD